MHVGTFRSALGRPQFRLALVAYALVSASVGIGAMVVAVALFQRGGTSGWATLGAVTRVAPFIVLSSISGALADRHDHRAVLRLAFCLQVLAALALAATATDAPLLVVAVVGLVSHGMWTIAYPTMASLVPRFVSTDDLAPANALLSTVESLAWIAGPGLGGVLITTVGFQSAAAVQAALALSGAGLATLMVHRHRAATDNPRLVHPAAHEGIRQSLRSAGAAITSSRPVTLALALLLVSNLVYGATQVLLLVAASDRLGMSDGGYGALNAALGAGACAALFVINRAARASRTTVVLAGSVLVAGIPLACLAVVDLPPVAIALLVVSGVGLVLTEVLALTAMQRTVPLDMVARVFGVLDSLSVVSILLGTVIAAPLINAIGIEGALAVIGGLVPLAAVFTAPVLLADGATSAGRFRLASDEVFGFELTDEFGEPVDATTVEATVRLLGALPLLRHASQAAVEAIAAESTLRTVSPGDVVIRQGDIADHFYAIIDGELDVSIEHSDGETQFVRTMGTGTGFGEVGLLNGTGRTATVIARSPATLVRVPGESFMRALGPGVASGGFGPAAAIRDYVMAR